MPEDPFASIAQPASDPFAAIAQPIASGPKATPGTDESGLPLFTSQWEATKYGAKEAAGGVYDAIKGFVQTFDPRQQPGENVLTQTPIYRMAKGVVEPLTHIGELPGAIKDIADSPSALHALATVAPRAGGQGAAALIPDLGGKMFRTAGEARAAVQPFARKFTGVENALKEDVGKAAEKHGKAVAEHKGATQDVANRDTLSRTIDEQSAELGKHLEKVRSGAHEEANSKFTELRKEIGNPEAPPDKLIASVKSIEENTLQGIPENIKEFRSILSKSSDSEGLSPEAFTKATGVELLGGEPVTWDYLQSIKSRIEARLRNGRTMNGDLKRGLYQLRDSVVNEMGAMAEPKAPGKWKAARDFYRQYKEDFDEPSGPSGSGSPVAQALNALDPKNIRQPFVSKHSTIGNRGVEILRKYPQHGGNEAAAHAEKLLGNVQERSTFSNKPAPNVPETPVVDAQKVAREAIATRAKNWGSFNARDIGILSSGVVGEFLGSLMGNGAFDRLLGAATGVIAYEGGKYQMSRALNNPKVIAWLEKTPQTEIDVINKIPGADKVKVINGLTQAAEQSGKPVRLSPQARQLLGPANVARILAASGAAAGSQVKNRKDALDLLGQPTQ